MPQGAAWRAQQTYEANVDHARLLLAQDKTRLAQELQDRRLAQHIKSCSASRWAEEGDLLELKEQQHLDLGTTPVGLLVASRVQHNRAGYAVRLTTGSGVPQKPVSSLHGNNYIGLSPVSRSAASNRFHRSGPPEGQ